jgi:RNA recognition motif-containing protein
MKIYVGNLSLETTEDELRNEFIVFGEVESVTIIDDEGTGSGQQRRYAYVEMASRSEGETAISKLEGKRMGDSIIHIIRSLEPRLSQIRMDPVHSISVIKNNSLKKGKRR